MDIVNHNKSVHKCSQVEVGGYGEERPLTEEEEEESAGLVTV